VLSGSEADFKHVEHGEHRAAQSTEMDMNEQASPFSARLSGLRGLGVGSAKRFKHHAAVSRIPNPESRIPYPVSCIVAAIILAAMGCNSKSSDGYLPKPV